MANKRPTVEQVNTLENQISALHRELINVRNLYEGAIVENNRLITANADQQERLDALRMVVDEPVNARARERVMEASVAGEPVFVLRAQDELAPGVVQAWAIQAAERGSGVERVGSAMAKAAEMLAWQKKHGCRVPR